MRDFEELRSEFQGLLLPSPSHPQHPSRKHRAFDIKTWKKACMQSIPFQQNPEWVQARLLQGPAPPRSMNQSSYVIFLYILPMSRRCITTKHELFIVRHISVYTAHASKMYHHKAWTIHHTSYFCIYSPCLEDVSQRIMHHSSYVIFLYIPPMFRSYVFHIQIPTRGRKIVEMVCVRYIDMCAGTHGMCWVLVCQKHLYIAVQCMNITCVENNIW